MLALTWPMLLATLSYTSMTGAWMWLPSVATSISVLAVGPLPASLYTKGMLTMSNYQGNATCTCAYVYMYMYICIHIFAFTSYCKSGNFIVDGSYKY